MMAKDAGKTLRMRRIFRADGRTVVVALDHGGFMGPAQGWNDPAPTLEAVVKGGADAVMTTAGIAERYPDIVAGRSSLILSTPMVAEMRPTVEAAVRLGADALKTFVTVGGADDSASMAHLWNTAVACRERSMPFLAEMFPVKSEKTPNPMDKDVVAKYSRIGAEYGADFIKTFYTGGADSFRAVTSTCPVPVIILGGSKTETDRDLLQVVHDAVKAGAGGVAIGRNVWQHKDPEAITRAIVGVVHSGMSPDDALKPM
jgi:fructose-bisphosphate aldolase / 2-amino-3,7-dideoxy-D-threo-hept-6-ulosonate synthase